MRADEIMTTEVATIDERASLGQALELMEERGVRHVPVLRQREVVGMLSDRDLRGYGLSLVTDMETLDGLKARLSATVSAAMSSDVITIHPSTEVGEIVDLLLEEKISAVPVVDEETNELLGIVSYVDVLAALREMLEAA